jgi:hypothetical protein
MTYKEINEVFKIPQRTLIDWKNQKDEDWRKRMFEFLRSVDKKDIEELLKKINKKFKD